MKRKDFELGLLLGLCAPPVPRGEPTILPIAFENLYAAFDPHTAELTIMPDQQTTDSGVLAENLCTNRATGGTDPGSAVLTGDHLEITIEIKESQEVQT